MKFHKEYLDLILVPSGLLIMFAYHLFLLYKYINQPHTTVMGFENNDKRIWVERIMQANKRDVSTALSVIQSNTTAATFLASVSLTLSSLIGAWIGNTSNIFFQRQLIYGDTRPTTITINTPDSFVPVSSVEIAVIRGGDFWSLGLRALYFALDLLLWFFGPIPMFISSLAMVLVLNYLDSNARPLHPNVSQGTQIQMPKRGFNL
ncbi:hypothetical protein LR48_Vigan09g239500 [Vigna angularis]|uniref:Uncharacterized protein n=1 Tax=Phaseolus angularis TaxID=3914 RepID=A0A0L9VF99_PHAAN|nr:uncharacterized protein HKW66_Vig0066030 [Vigna angularis]KOM53736.1 hypothetical protein LR48_Vigan09g239500 [Vigna angularis]